MEQEVLTFIDKFKFTNKKEVEKVFLEGDCYYFAIILKTRFKYARLMYDSIMGHFTAKIHGELYDITGKVTEKYKDSIPFHEVDEIEKTRIIRDCVRFESR